MKAFRVYLGRKHIDTVFYSKSDKVTTDEVKRSLVDHDGYDPRIVVVQSPM
jgi:ribosomal protein S24E